MTITLTIDDQDLRQFLDWAGDEFPFAAMIGINRTAEDSLAAGRQAILTSFLVRRPAFLLPPVVLPREWRATKTNPTAVIAIGDGGSKKLGDRRRAILEKFERGGLKRGSERLPIALPTKWLRPSPETDIPQRMYPKYLVGQFDQRGNLVGIGRAGRRRYKGRKVAPEWFVKGEPGQPGWGVYQRLERSVILLWAFRRQIRIPPRLRWVDTVRRTVDQRLTANMVGAIEYALRTAAFARGRSAGRALTRLAA